MRVLALALIAVMLPAQVQEWPTRENQIPTYWDATHTFTLSGSAAVITIQQPAANAQRVRLQSAFVYSSAACSFVQERDGSAATETALTLKKTNPQSPLTPNVTAWRNSNSTGGAQIGPSYAIPAGGSAALDVSRVYLIGNGTTRNYTIRSASCTGTFTVSILGVSY